MPPPLPRSERRGRGWMIIALTLAVLLAVTWWSSRWQGWFGGRAGASRSHGSLFEVVLEDNDAASKILVIDVVGVIAKDLWGDGSEDLVAQVAEQLRRAAEDDDVRAVVLRVNSPGGEVLASDEINRAITGFRKKCQKPVVAAMESVAASGGYYVSVPCDWIVANELTITGSIGVIMPSFNYRGLLDKVGVRPEFYKSGRYKDMMSGVKASHEILPEERQLIQTMIDQTFARFKQVVKEGRGDAYAKNRSEGGRALSADWEEFADGRVLTGIQAHDKGFVDELGNFEVAVTRAKRLANVASANVIRYEHPFDLGNLFRFLGESSSKVMRIDLGIDLPRLEAGRLYFLSSTLVR
jgi:protease-4